MFGLFASLASHQEFTLRPFCTAGLARRVLIQRSMLGVGPTISRQAGMLAYLFSHTHKALLYIYGQQD